MAITREEFESYTKEFIIPRLTETQFHSKEEHADYIETQIMPHMGNKIFGTLQRTPVETGGLGE